MLRAWNRFGHHSANSNIRRQRKSGSRYAEGVLRPCVGFIAPPPSTLYVRNLTNGSLTSAG